MSMKKKKLSIDEEKIKKLEGNQENYLRGEYDRILKELLLRSKA